MLKSERSNRALGVVSVNVPGNRCFERSFPNFKDFPRLFKTGVHDNVPAPDRDPHMHARTKPHFHSRIRLFVECRRKPGSKRERRLERTGNQPLTGHVWTAHGNREKTIQQTLLP